MRELLSILCIRLYYDQQVFTERRVLVPNDGEMVAARCPVDSGWYRVRVIDCEDDNVLVSSVLQ